MNLMQRYILGELLRVFALLVVILTVMLVFVGVLKEAAERGLGFAQIVQIMPFIVPSMLPFTIPATLLLTVTVVYGRLAGDLEFTAVKAAGINPISLLTPAFVLGFVLAICSFGLTNYAIPWGIDNTERIVTQAMEEIFLDMLSSQHLVSDPENGYSITVENVTENGILINPTFRLRNDSHDQVTMNAEMARVRFDMKEKKVLLHLKRARGSIPGQDAAAWLDDRILPLPLDLASGERSARNLTIDTMKTKMSESKRDIVLNRQQRDQEAAMLLLTGNFQQLAGDRLLQYANFESSQQLDNRKMYTEIHNRYSMAASCLFFVFLGGPFAVIQARRQFITSFIMCFLPILLFYYPTMFLMANLGKTAAVDPAWGMWVPNMIMGAVGIMMLKRVTRY
ncbi:MAG: LptF/LptG family permease [Fuerstiella sp.]|nr:YjgP/YjgQ family permease [Fuerstiella sp.]